MAEQRYKTQVKQSLNGLIIPDLANIVNKFVQITSLGGQMVNWWHFGHFLTSVLVKRGSPIHRPGYYHTLTWSGLISYTTWDGPEIFATFDPREINKAANVSDFRPAVFRFSDANNWSLDIVE